MKGWSAERKWGGGEGKERWESSAGKTLSV